MSRLARRLVVVTILLAACSWAEVERIEVEGWPVDCRKVDTTACRGVAALALNNLAWSRPEAPTGVITVSERSCPDVPDWADPRRCWRAVIPLSDGTPGCLLVAARPQVGGYGQVGGEVFTGGNPRPGAPDPPPC